MNDTTIVNIRYAKENIARQRKTLKEATAILKKIEDIDLDPEVSLVYTWSTDLELRTRDSTIDPRTQLTMLRKAARSIFKKWNDELWFINPEKDTSRVYYKRKDSKRLSLCVFCPTNKLKEFEFIGDNCNVEEIKNEPSPYTSYSVVCNITK